VTGAVEHLRERGLLSGPSAPVVTPLPGGVSGETVLVEAPPARLVVKRALARLLVAGEWTAKPERAMTEAAALALLNGLTPAHTPQLRDADPATNTIVMSAAPAGWVSWKAVLMGDVADPSAGPAAVAGTLGSVLASWHAATWHDPQVAARFADYEAFEQLRLAPFHRTVAARHPAVAPAVLRCVAELLAVRTCLVHGDFSPKNVLVGADGVLVLDFEVADGSTGTALVPAGASAGSHEAPERRDGGHRYGGYGVRAAVAAVHETIRPALLGVPAAEVDGVLAGLNAGTLGANALLAVSLAALRAAAAAAGCSLARHLAGPEGDLLLPMPMVNVLSGGAHAGAALDLQDVLVVPVGAGSFAQAIEWAAAVREAARAEALGRGHPEAVLVADEGGLGIALPTNRAALDLLCAAAERAGLALGTQVGIAIDLAATQLYEDGAYHLRREDRRLTAAGLVAEVADWCAAYPVVSVEDVLAEDDWDGWREASAVLAGRVELVGDDLLVTRPDRLRRAIDTGTANSVLVKVNQNGLVSGAAAVVDMARAAGYRTVVSARSGDTEDPWLADLAVGWRAGQIKVGSTHRAERTAKWNRLLELEATERTAFAGPWQGGRPGREP
jgi:enolase